MGHGLADRPHRIGHGTVHVLRGEDRMYSANSAECLDTSSNPFTWASSGDMVLLVRIPARGRERGLNP
ncbi:MAG: hypothetical protein DYH08_12210 [Actinobacteria bacterium ATB1]|nr:hypothetical protein [Actinobacteria bacterium ATB1]